MIQTTQFYNLIAVVDPRKCEINYLGKCSKIMMEQNQIHIKMKKLSKRVIDQDIDNRQSIANEEKKSFLIEKQILEQ